MSPNSLTIGLLQREIAVHDPAGNLLGALEMLRNCARQGVDLFVLTELWSTGLLDPTEPSTLELAEEVDGPTVEALREFCQESQTHLLAGTLPIRSGDGIRNTALLIDPTGAVILETSKIHLFRPMGEDQVFVPGDKLGAAEVNGVGVGVIICYDLRFPGLTRRLAHAGCEVILVPGLWPEERIEHWEVLLRARAIENQVFAVGVNGILSQHGMFFPGHSMIVGPTGEALNSPEMRESAIVRRIDLGQVRRLRGEMCYIDEEREVSDVEWGRSVNERRG